MGDGTPSHPTEHTVRISSAEKNWGGGEGEAFRRTSRHPKLEHRKTDGLGTQFRRQNTGENMEKRGKGDCIPGRFARYPGAISIIILFGKQIDRGKGEDEECPKRGAGVCDHFRVPGGRLRDISVQGTKVHAPHRKLVRRLEEEMKGGKGKEKDAACTSSPWGLRVAPKPELSNGLGRDR